MASDLRRELGGEETAGATRIAPSNGMGIIRCTGLVEAIPEE